MEEKGLVTFSDFEGNLSKQFLQGSDLHEVKRSEEKTRKTKSLLNFKFFATHIAVDLFICEEERC